MQTIKLPQPTFFEHGPIGFVLRLSNSGSVHEKPSGTITVKNMFGKQIASVAVNSDGGNILPGTIRRFEEDMASKQMFGRYTATFNGKYLDDNHKITGSVSFWVIPWKLILLLLVALLVLIWLFRVALRRYNAFIIAQARRR
jgi:hypothetical protein